MPGNLFQLPAYAPWVDKDGRPLPIFVEWMQRLWDRAGGSFTTDDAAALASGGVVSQDITARNAADLATGLALAAGSRDDKTAIQATAELALLLSMRKDNDALRAEIDALKTQVAILTNKGADRAMQPEDVIGIVQMANGARTIRYASGWNDYLMPANSFALGASAPTLTVFRDSHKGLAFVGTGASVNTIHGNMHYLHDLIRGGSADGAGVYIHLHASHIIASPSGNFVFNVEHSTARRGQVIPASSNFDLTCTPGVQYEHSVYEASTAQTIDDAEVDALSLLTISRDPGHASDTFANDVYLWQVDAHYRSTTPGLTDDRTPDANGFFTRRSY